MESFNNFLLATITVLIGAIGYFLKRMFDRIDEMGHEVRDIRNDIADIKPKMEILWQDRLGPVSSPRQLNERGQKVLEESGIKKIIDEKWKDLSIKLKLADPKNPYDAEQAIIGIIKDMPKDYPEIVEDLKTGAFQTGENIDAVLFAGAIYARNKVFPTLGFPIDSTDAHVDK